MVSGVVSSPGTAPPAPPCAAIRRPWVTHRTTRQIAGFQIDMSPLHQGSKVLNSYVIKERTDYASGGGARAKGRNRLRTGRSGGCEASRSTATSGRAAAVHVATRVWTATTPAGQHACGHVQCPDFW